MSSFICFSFKYLGTGIRDSLVDRKERVWNWGIPFLLSIIDSLYLKRSYIFCSSIVR